MIHDFKFAITSLGLLVLCLVAQPAFSRATLGISHPEKGSLANEPLAEKLEEASGNLITVHNYNNNKTLLSMLTKFRKLDAALISRQTYDQQENDQLVALGEVQVSGANHNTTLILAARSDLTEDQEYQLIQGYQELIMSTEGLELLERYADRPRSGVIQVAALQAPTPVEPVKNATDAQDAIPAPVKETAAQSPSIDLVAATEQPAIAVETIPEQAPVAAEQPKPTKVVAKPVPVTTAQNRTQPAMTQPRPVVIKKGPVETKPVKTNGNSRSWQPHVDVTAKLGNDRSLAEAELFMPLAQTGSSLLFLDLRLQRDDNDASEGNFGLGYRTIVNDWILGGYGFYDVRNSANDNRFHQYTLGLEALTESNDLRLNAYMADDKHYLVAKQDSLDEILYSGNYLIHRTGGVAFETREKAMSGFDAEIGWLLPWFEHQEVRGYLGGYHFSASGVEDVTGPRGRLEVRFNDIFNWPGSLFELGGEIRNDDVRDTDYFITARARFPLSVWQKAPAKRHNGLSRRMTERIQRDPDIIVARQHVDTSTDIVNENLTSSSQEILLTHVDTNSTTPGTGSFETPCATLACAETDGSGGSIILLYADSVFDGESITLDDNQRLLGDTGSHTVDTDQLGQVELPRASAGTDPAIIQNAPDVAVQLADGNEVSNLSISDALTAIAGVDVGGVNINNVNIKGVDIGISLVGLTAQSNNIANNSVQSAFFDGIYILSNDSAPVSVSITGNTLDLYDNGTDSYGLYGISVINDGGQSLHADIFGNDVTGVDETGIYIVNTTEGVTTEDKLFSATLDDNFVDNSLFDGITIINEADTTFNVMDITLLNNRASGDIDNGGADFYLENSGRFFELTETGNTDAQGDPATIETVGSITTLP